MKHIDEIYKEWSGVHHTVNSCHPVHDSEEACDFAEFYAKQALDEYSNWLWEMDRLKSTNQLPPFETPEAMTEYFLKAKIRPLHECLRNSEHLLNIPCVSVSVCPHCQNDSSKIVESEKRKCFGCGRLFYGHTER